MLTEIDISASVEYIAPDAFEGCQSIVVSAEEDSYARRFAFNHGMLLKGENNSLIGKAGANAIFCFSDGLLTVSGSGAIFGGEELSSLPWTSLRDEIREIVIEEGITALSMYSFAECDNLVSATIASSVRSVSSNAFRDSSLLFIRAAKNSAAWRFAAAQNIPCVEMGVTGTGSAGMNCEYTIEDGVLTISGEGAVSDSLVPSMQPWYPVRTQFTQVVIEEPVSRIGTLAFSDCVSLTQVTIPDSVTYIDSTAFAGVSDDLEIHGHAGTYAESWANEHGFAFRVHAQIVRNPDSLITLYHLDTITLSIEATGDGLQYQWQEYFTDYQRWYDVADISYNGTGKNASYTRSHGSDENGHGFRCRVTDAYGDVVYSETATLHFIKAVEIIKHPGNVMCSIGDTVVFEIEAIGDGLMYEWQIRLNGTGEWRHLSSSETLTVVYKGNDKNLYQCIVSDMYGNSVHSFFASIKTATVIEGPLSISVVSGDQARFHITASGNHSNISGRSGIQPHRNGTIWMTVTLKLIR